MSNTTNKTPVGVPSGWEMNAALVLAKERILLNWGHGVRFFGCPWRIDDPWSHWFFFGDHTIHPEAEC